VAIGTIRNLDYVILLRDPGVLSQCHEVSSRDGLRPRGLRGSWHDGPAVDGAACIQLAFRLPPPAVEQCHQELIASGVEILSPPEDLPSWRHRTLFFRDPEGNIIEIYAEI
jgi:glyoxylase I family protein